MTWKATSGSVSSAGVFQAPTVTSESYSRITGCVAKTISCDVILLRILPFRITPSDPLVNVGDNIQLDAVQGGGLLAPQWSVVAGGGAITSGGLFTAPNGFAVRACCCVRHRWIDSGADIGACLRRFCWAGQQGLRLRRFHNLHSEGGELLPVGGSQRKQGLRAGAEIALSAHSYV